MKVLIVGAGVIGTVYGAQLAAAGATVSVLTHGPRTDEVATAGLSARDLLDGGQIDAAVPVVRIPAETTSAVWSAGVNISMSNSAEASYRSNTGGGQAVLVAEDSNRAGDWARLML